MFCICSQSTNNVATHTFVKVSLWTLSQRKNYDVGGKGRYTWNILQWEESNIKSKKMTNGDYFNATLS